MRAPKRLTAVVAVVSCFLLASCGAKNAGSVSGYSPRQIAEIIIAAQADIPALTPLTPGDSLFADYISSNYLLDAGDFIDGAVFFAFGVEASEITVLLLKNGADMTKTTGALLEYQERRAAALTGYVPLQADLVERGVVVSNGAYAALLICENASGAESLFLACFSSDPPALPNTPLPLPAETGGAGAGGDPVDGERDDGDGGDTGSGTQSGEPDDGETDGEIDGDDVKSDGGKIAVPGLTGEPGREDENDDEQPGTTVANEDPQPEGPGDGREADGADQTTDVPAENGGQETQGTGGPGAAAVPPEPTQPAELPGPAVTPGPAADVFDPAAILTAWRTGNSAALTEKNKAILEACREVIGDVIRSGMTDYEKGLAIHDWIVMWASYDTEANNNAPTARPSPDNDNPYGVFYNKKAICSGYTSTFQLFMDILGIECITVNGFARNMETVHAWNMVRLDGEWYCVDVTWDDPTGVFPPGFVSHDYFNVTSQYLRDHQHIWDETAVPEATAVVYSWENQKN